MDIGGGQVWKLIVGGEIQNWSAFLPDFDICKQYRATKRCSLLRRVLVIYGNVLVLSMGMSSIWTWNEYILKYLDTFLIWTSPSAPRFLLSKWLAWEEWQSPLLILEFGNNLLGFCSKLILLCSACVHTCFSPRLTDNCQNLNFKANESCSLIVKSDTHFRVTNRVARLFWTF